MYSHLLKLLQHIDPEDAHSLAAAALKMRLFSFIPQNFGDHLRTEAMGLCFQTPFGIAAGFDKFATLVMPLYNLGFGHVEVGTVTFHPQKGNVKPRLHRIMEDKALINSMGFNNPGALKMRENILKLRYSATGEHRETDENRAKNKHGVTTACSPEGWHGAANNSSNTSKHSAAGTHLPIIGVNIGKSRACPLEDAPEDYSKSFELLADVADYMTINVSSPNTEGLRDLQTKENLNKILTAVLPIANRFRRPVLLKISPDLSDSGVREVGEVVKEFELAGVIASNTTVGRQGLAPKFAKIPGGLSGPMLKTRALEILKLLRQDLPKNRFCIISVGGVQTCFDVLERLECGADLVQGYTAFIYNGPQWASSVNRGLDKYFANRSQ